MRKWKEKVLITMLSLSMVMTSMSGLSFGTIKAAAETAEPAEDTSWQDEEGTVIKEGETKNFSYKGNRICLYVEPLETHGYEIACDNTEGLAVSLYEYKGKEQGYELVTGSGNFQFSTTSLKSYLEKDKKYKIVLSTMNQVDDSETFNATLSKTDKIAIKDDFLYEVFSYGASICGYFGTDKTHVTVPAKINGYNVTDASENLFKNHTEIEKVTFAEGITGLGDTLFTGCSSLKEIELPSTLDGYGICASTFLGLHNANITLPNGSEYLECKDNALYDNSIPEQKYLRYYFGTAANFDVPEGVNFISLYAFSDASLEKVTLPESLESMGTAVFNEKLKTATFKNKNTCFESADMDFGNTGSFTNVGMENGKYKFDVTVYGPSAGVLEVCCKDSNIKFVSTDSLEETPGSQDNNPGYNTPTPTLIPTPTPGSGSGTTTVPDDSKDADDKATTTTSSPKAPTLKAKKSGSKKVKLSWKKISGAKGYQIASTDNKSKKMKNLCNVSSEKTSYTCKFKTKQKKYKYRLRYYKTVNGKKVWSKWSSTKSIAK